MASSNYSFNLQQKMPIPAFISSTLLSRSRKAKQLILTLHLYHLPLNSIQQPWYSEMKKLDSSNMI